MSEDNSGRDKQEQSFEQMDGDQTAHLLDSLIAQFQGDCDIDLPIETDQARPSVDAGLIEAKKAEQNKSPAQTTAAIEAIAEPEPTNGFGILLASFVTVAIAVLGIVVWQNFAGDENRDAIFGIAQPVTNSAPVQAAMLPVAPATTDQQAAITVLEDKEVPTAAPEQHEPQTSEQEQTPRQEQADIPALVTPPVATRQDADPVLRKVVTPKSGMAWAVNLTSVSTLASAEEIGMGLASRGVTSELKQVTIGGKLFYRIRIPGFGSKQEAERARLPFLKEREFRSAWLELYRATPRLPE